MQTASPEVGIVAADGAIRSVWDDVAEGETLVPVEAHSIGSAGDGVAIIYQGYVLQ